MKSTSILPLVDMTRPLNLLLTGAAVALGYAIGRGEVGAVQMVCGPLSAMLIAAFGNLDNDIVDVAIDRVNRPARPLPSARVSLRNVQIISLLILVMGLLSAQFCGTTALAVAGAVAIWLALYNRWGKRWLLVGNLMVALAGGLPLIYAGIITGPAPKRWMVLWIGFALAAGFHLVREVLKDIQDVEGDSRAHVFTLPVVLGVRTAGRIAAGMLLVVSILSVMPGILRWFNQIYLYGALFLIMLPSGNGFHRLWVNPTVAEAARWASLAKLMMACGLVLLWLGST